MRRLDKRKLTKLFLFLTIIGILILTILAQTQGPITEGKIKSFDSSKDYSKIMLYQDERELILFEEIPSNIEKNMDVKIYGKEETYQNKIQIIIDKIGLI